MLGKTMRYENQPRELDKEQREHMTERHEPGQPTQEHTTPPRPPMQEQDNASAGNRRTGSGFPFTKAWEFGGFEGRPRPGRYPGMC